jgi:hypothetical protein
MKIEIYFCLGSRNIIFNFGPDSTSNLDIISSSVAYP